MSARYDLAATVLDTAVRYYLPPSEIAELINNIFNSLDYYSLEWDNCYPYTIEDVIVTAKSIVNDKYSSRDKKAYSKWLELHGE
jgi:hypothetical protein